MIKVTKRDQELGYLFIRAYIDYRYKGVGKLEDYEDEWARDDAVSDNEEELMDMLADYAHKDIVEPVEVKFYPLVDKWAKAKGYRYPSDDEFSTMIESSAWMPEEPGEGFFDSMSGLFPETPEDDRWFESSLETMERCIAAARVGVFTPDHAGADKFMDMYGDDNFERE